MESVAIYKDRNENLYVWTNREEGFFVRLSDGTRHDGTTISDGFFLVEEVCITNQPDGGISPPPLN